MLKFGLDYWLICRLSEGINIRKMKNSIRVRGVGKNSWVADIVERQRVARQIRAKAMEALEASDMREILELAGTAEKSGEASAALKAVLAERITEYTIKAMGEAKRRGTRLGAAAIIIAASKTK